jgi:integrase
MARTPKPWYWKDRKSWFVTIGGQRHNLGPDRKDALQLFHQLMTQPVRPAVPGETVTALIDAFLEWTHKHRAQRTYEWYLQRCQWFIESIPSLTVAQLKPFHVQQWLDAHPSWSDGHRRGCIISVQRAFRWALKMGYIDTNPVAYIEKPQGGRRDRVISPTEYDSILSLIRDNRFRDLVTTAWETGARPQELRRVERRHVDLRHSRWVFPQEEAKGKQRVRIVYLSDIALSITQRLMLQHGEGPLFRNTAGRPWTVFAVNCRFERIKKHTEVKYCLYNFRHSFATRMLEHGLDALTVSVLLGHSDTSMLGRVYQHLSHNPEHLVEQIRKASA